MPSRLLTSAIVLFWLAMTGLLFYHEIWPRIRPGEAPPFVLDLGAEVGSNTVEWDVFLNGSRAGRGRSQVKRLPDRTFELTSHFRFDDFKLSKIIKIIEIDLQKFTGDYIVTEEGGLVSMSGSMSAELRSTDPKTKLEAKLGTVDLKFAARIEDGQINPSLEIRSLLGNFEPKLGKSPFNQRASVLNPMHPSVNRISGLSSGRTWRIHLFDPVEMLQGSVGNLLGGMVSGSSIPILDATVKTDTLFWGGEETPCFLIEYAEPGDMVKARTWVRQRDDVVLQQEARHAGMSIILQRVHAKNP